MANALEYWPSDTSTKPSVAVGHTANCGEPERFAMSMPRSRRHVPDPSCRGGRTRSALTTSAVIRPCSPPVRTARSSASSASSAADSNSPRHTSMNAAWADEGHHVALGAALGADLPHLLGAGVGLVESAGPAKTVALTALARNWNGTSVSRSSNSSARLHRVLVESLARHELRHHRHREDLARQAGSVQVCVTSSAASATRRSEPVEVAFVKVRVGQQEKALDHQCGVVPAVGQCAVEQNGGLDEAVVEDVHRGEQVRRPRRAAVPRGRLHRRWTEQLGRRCSVSPARKWCSAPRIRRTGVSPPRLIARSTSSAAADGAPRACAVSAASSRPPAWRCRRVRMPARGGGPAARVFDEIGQGAVHLAPLVGAGHTLCTPRASRGWAKRTRLPSISTMPSVSGPSSSSTTCSGVLGGGLGQEVHRRRADCGGGEQHVWLSSLILLEARADQFGQRAGQVEVGGDGLIVHGAGQFQCVERIAAGQLADAHIVGARQRPTQSVA